MTQSEIFREPNSLVGRVVEMPTHCPRCGGYDASIGHGRGPHAASLLCACGNHLGWLPKAAFNFIHETAVHFGADVYEPIIIRGALEAAAMTEKKFDDTNRGVLFRDDKKTKETDRDYSGTINVNGEEFWLSAWVKTSKAGRKFMSLSVKPKAEAATPSGKSRAEEMSDGVSF
jgi:hypothetical protein